MLPDDPRHGTTAGHQAHRKDGERACDACVAAKTRYEKTRKVYGDRMVPAVGTRRRIQALMAMGHSGAVIAEAMGVTYQAVHKIEVGTSPRIFRSTAEKVAATYARLCMTIPNGYHRTRIRNKAARLGYAPPLAWDDIDDPDERHADKYLNGYGDKKDFYREIDEVMVVRILDGDKALSRQATLPERREIVRRWTTLGRPLNELARLTGWKVERYYKAAA